MEFLRKTGALVVMLMMTCTALPALTGADTVACDGSPGCSEGVTITANDISVTTAQDTPLIFSLPGSASDGTPITFSVADNATVSDQEGTVTFSPGPGRSAHANPITYTPPDGFTGTDTFTYQAKIGLNDASALVTITVTGSGPVDITPPVFTSTPADQTFSTTTTTAIPTLVPATATDNSGVAPTIIHTPTSFPVGITTVTWTATDGAGNHSSVTSDVRINLVDQYRISSDKAAATMTESFTATALSFDGTSAYVPAVGATIGVVLSSSPSTEVATAVADSAGQVTFTVDTAGSYLIGLQDDLYATTTPITITEVIPDPTPAPTPVVTTSVGNGPPVAPGPVYTAPAAPVAPTPIPAPTPAFVYSDAAIDVLTPTPVISTPTPEPVVVAPQPQVLAAQTEPAAPQSEPAVETVPAPIGNLAVAQSAAAAAPVSDNTAYEILGLIIVLLALAGLGWQWKKRNT